ncbi:hypothetical protein BDZ45DRAFT_326290 [Acephala macrosclerotiorum]|nr:hypothetical protein BDZ45DRAFT_326290 [Acephala macrosclerotiorum]
MIGRKLKQMKEYQQQPKVLPSDACPQCPGTFGSLADERPLYFIDMACQKDSPNDLAVQTEQPRKQNRIPSAKHSPHLHCDVALSIPRNLPTTRDPPLYLKRSDPSSHMGPLSSHSSISTTQHIACFHKLPRQERKIASPRAPGRNPNFDSCFKEASWEHPTRRLLICDCNP